MASVAGRRKRTDTTGVDSSSGGDISANTNEDSPLEVESASSPVLAASPPSCSTGPALEKLQFDSWDEFHAFVREYEAQTYQKEQLRNCIRLMVYATSEREFDKHRHYMKHMIELGYGRRGYENQNPSSSRYTGGVLEQRGSRRAVQIIL
ncbi:hypothetical protein F441_19550 [Phytophthora nicotianae CJ01A1]|uniref:Uncharacterized protein n=1 Tax=Phytophthora nicotianae CJ01A1 TaxID=1317063 RepID=W2W0H8_PHYNI|nr:hypothetical protein F441_19550 [Phytophthora nicotianae CJ01A1]